MNKKGFIPLPIPFEIPKTKKEWLFSIFGIICFIAIIIFLIMIGKGGWLILINNIFYWIWFVVIAIGIIMIIIEKRKKPN